MAKNQFVPLLFVGLAVIFILLAIFNARAVQDYGVTPLAFTLICLFAAIYLLARARGYSKPELAFPASLRKLSFWYWSAIGTIVVVGTTAIMVSEQELRHLEGFTMIIGMGLLSWSVWGTLIYVLLVLSIWFLWFHFFSSSAKT